MKFRFLFGAVGLAGLMAQSAIASTPAELSVAGMIAGRDLFPSDTTSDQTTFDDQWARLGRIARFPQRIFNDPAAEEVWEEAQADATRGLAVLARIAEIDNKKPSNWDVIVSSIKAATQDTKNKPRTEWGADVWLRLLAEFGKTKLESDFRMTELALNAKLAELAGTVNNSYPGQGIAILHFPSWQGAYDHDLLMLKNQSGRDLSVAAVFVTFRGYDGSQVTQLHRVASWNDNQELYFKYPYYQTSYAEGQTVAHPARVEVSVFSPEGFLQDVKVWTDLEYANTIRRYLADVRLSGMFLGEYVEDGTGKLFYPGVKFSVKGLYRLPVQRITVRLIRRGETKEVYWNWNKYLPSGEEVVLRSSYFEQFGKSDPPEQKQIILEFTDSTAKAFYSF